MNLENLALHLIQLLAFLVAYTCGYEHIKFMSSKGSGKTGSSEVLKYVSLKEEDIASKRKRRDTGQGQCPSLPGKPMRHWSSLSGDKNFNLALVWVGKSSPTQLLLTTLEFGLLITIRAPSKLYRRTEEEKTFHQIQHEIKNGDIRKDFGIMKSPVNADKVLLISYSYAFSSRPSTLYISTDGARSFTNALIPFQVRTNEPMQFHPVKEDWILALDNGQSNQFGAWLSTDFGKTWKLLKPMVESVKWETNTNTDRDLNTIYLSTKSKFSRFGSHFPGILWRSTDLGKTFEKLADNIHNFGVQGKFLFVSVDSEQEGEKRTVKVSSNSGDIFNAINIPAVGPDLFFSILDMNEGLIFLHVDEPRDTGFGTLYISDSDGLAYTKSLERHFYTNDGITDFYRVESMRGVFITHQLDPSDNTITSLITFNRGVTWEPLHLSDEQCKGVSMRAGQTCSLHFHNTYSQAKGVPIQPPLSTETALGLIILHGHQGDALTGKADVYLSNNGGYVWEKVLSGPHHYAIGDHGNLIVAVSKLGESTNRLVYSLDRGKCWHDLEFSDDNITVRGLITEPGSKARTFSLWGYESSPGLAKEWVVVTVDFHNVFHRVCHKDDFESWYPHSEKHADGCLLGLKEVYPKVKENAFCFFGKDYKPEIKKTRCKCTDQDKECNFGFDRKGDKCVRNPKVDLKVCKNGKEIPVTDEDGYRLIPGDQCTGGPTSTINFVNAQTECAGAKNALVKKGKQNDKKEIEDVQAESKSSKAMKKRSHFITIFLALSFVALSATFIGFYLRKVYKTRASGQYRYSQLKAQANEDESPSDSTKFDPRPKGLRPYKDESDEDTTMLDL